MFMKMRNLAKKIAVLCVLIIALLVSITLLLKQQSKDGERYQHSQIDSETKEISENDKLPKTSNDESNPPHVQGVPLKEENRVLIVDSLPDPFVKHDSLTVRRAIEKANRPDLAGRPSGPERIRAHHKTLQIPEEQLVVLSSAELVEKTLQSPLAVMMRYQLYPDGGMSRFAGGFNGAATLLERPDMAKEVLSYYKRVSAFDQLSEWERTPSFVYHFAMCETFLSTNEALKQLEADPKLRQDVIRSIIMSRQARTEFDSSQAEPVFGRSTIVYSAMAVAKYLDSLDSPKYQQWVAQESQDAEDGKEDLFVKRGLSYAEAEEVLVIGEEYVQSIK